MCKDKDFQGLSLVYITDWMIKFVSKSAKQNWPRPGPCLTRFGVENADLQNFPIDLIFASLLTQYVVHNKNVFGISGKINNLVDGERQETKVKNALRAAQ